MGSEGVFQNFLPWSFAIVDGMAGSATGKATPLCRGCKMERIQLSSVNSDPNEEARELEWRPSTARRRKSYGNFSKTWHLASYFAVRQRNICGPMVVLTSGQALIATAAFLRACLNGGTIRALSCPHTSKASTASPIWRPIRRFCSTMAGGRSFWTPRRIRQWHAGSRPTAIEASLAAR
jgi:hypothetical protein